MYGFGALGIAVADARNKGEAGRMAEDALQGALKAGVDPRIGKGRRCEGSGAGQEA